MYRGFVTNFNQFRFIFVLSSSWLFWFALFLAENVPIKKEKKKLVRICLSQSEQLSIGLQLASKIGDVLKHKGMISVRKRKWMTCEKHPNTTSIHGKGYTATTVASYMSLYYSLPLQAMTSTPKNPKVVDLLENTSGNLLWYSKAHVSWLTIGLWIIDFH